MPAAVFAEMALAAASEALGLPVEAVAVNRFVLAMFAGWRTEATTQLVRGNADLSTTSAPIHRRSADAIGLGMRVAERAPRPETLPSAS